MATIKSDLINVLHRGNVVLEERRLTMKGGVYTKEKCPICGQKFERTSNDILCVAHQTRPKKLFVQFYSAEIGEYVQLYSDSRGIPFTSYEQAYRILTKIRAEVDAGSFDPSRYVSQKLKPLRFENWASSWLEKRKMEQVPTEWVKLSWKTL